MAESNRMKNGKIVDTLAGVDFVEIVNFGGFNWEACERFFCHILEYNLNIDFVTETFEKRDLFEAQGEKLLENLAEKIILSVCGDIFRKAINEEYKYVTESWMEEYVDDRVKYWFPLKSGNSIVEIEDDHGVEDHDRAKSINTMPSHFGSYILSHSKRLMNVVINHLGRFSNNSS